MMILNWLKRKLTNRRRAIFRYWDGSNDRCADPMEVYRSLLEHPEFDWETTPDLIEVADEKESSEAIALTAAAVREAFGLPPFADGGLTEWECYSLLGDFVAQMLALKKNTSDTPISPAPTEPESSESSVTRPPSGCGSTSPGQSCAAPIPS